MTTADKTWFADQSVLGRKQCILERIGKVELKPIEDDTHAFSGSCFLIILLLH